MKPIQSNKDMKITHKLVCPNLFKTLKQKHFRPKQTQTVFSQYTAQTLLDAILEGTQSVTSHTTIHFTVCLPCRHTWMSCSTRRRSRFKLHNQLPLQRLMARVDVV